MSEKKMVFNPETEELIVPYLHDDGTLKCGRALFDSNYAHQIFTFRVAETGVYYHFDIPKLRRICENTRDVVRVDALIEKEQIEHVMKHNGIEEGHLPRLDGKIDQPGILVLFPEGDHVLVDGNHRFVRRYQLGKPDMVMYMPTLEQAEKSLLAVPPEFSKVLWEAISAL